MGLGGLQKTTALRLIEGLEIEQRGADVTVRFLTVVPFFKVRMHLPLQAAAVTVTYRLRMQTRLADSRMLVLLPCGPRRGRRSGQRLGRLVASGVCACWGGK